MTYASTRLRSLAFVVAVSVAGALATVTIVGRTASAENPQPSITPNASLKNNLSVLARPGASSDLLPSSLSVGSFLVDKYGIAPASARKVGSNAWLVPGSRGACLMQDLGDRGVAGGCTDTARLLAGGLAGTIAFRKPAGAVQVFAAVPDDATSIRVDLANGGQADATASMNFVSMTVQGDPTSLSYTGPDGASQQVPLATDHSNRQVVSPAG